MKRIYTCFVCGFPWATEEEECPTTCPGCGAPSTEFLSEPWCGSIEKRRIHVDPPPVDPHRDPFDITFHSPKDFAPQKGDGRVRRWVMGYERGQAEQMRSFYTDIFGWDIIDTEGSDPENPTMYCATGPGTPDWEMRVPSFTYGFLIPDTGDGAFEPYPSFIIEVKDIEETFQKVKTFGGKVLRERFTVNGNDYAVVEDSEGNKLYLWELKDQIPDYCIHPVVDKGAR